MSPPRVGNRALPFTLVLLVATLAPAPAAAAADEPALELQARTDVVEATLTRGHAIRAPADAFAAAPQLEVLLAFSQPILRGQDDLVAALWVRPADGAPSWSGLWWADSSAGIAPPRKVTIGSDGLFLLLDGGALATSDRVRVTFGFAGDNGATWKQALAPVPVLDAPPATPAVALGGAVATSVAYPDAPQVILLSVWNLLPRSATVGYSTLDRGGNVLEDVTVGRCADGAGDSTERGCRARLLAEKQGEQLVTWHIDADGRRVIDARHHIADLERAPHVLGQADARDDGPTLALRLQTAR